MTPPIFDPSARHWLWPEHDAAMTYAQARALATGKRQAVQLVTGSGGLAWYVHTASPNRAHLYLGIEWAAS